GAILRGALTDSDAEFARVIVAPGPDRPIGPEGERKVCAGGQPDNSREEAAPTRADDFLWGRGDQAVIGRPGAEHAGRSYTAAKSVVAPGPHGAISTERE